MKNLKLLALCMLIISASCKNDDYEKTSIDPIDQLPLATKTGANTAGCLVNGEAFLPKSNFLSLHFFYVGEKDLGLFIRNEENNMDRAISITSLNKTLEEGRTYILSERKKYSKYASYSIGSASPPRKDYYQTNSSVTGEFTITLLDVEKAIISGTFWFDSIDSDGTIAKIREGRFDMEY